MPEQQDLAAEVRDFMKSMSTTFDGFNTKLLGVEDTAKKALQFAATQPNGSPGGRTNKADTLGSKFVASSIYKAFREQNQEKSGKFVIAATELITNALLAPPMPVWPVRIATEPNIYAPLTVRSLLNPRPLKNGGSVEYLRQKPTTGTAAVQYPQGSKKAEINLDFELATANIATTAAFTKASRQVIEDDAQVEAIIDGELMYQVYLAEEKEILNGNGSPGHMAGLLTLAPTFPTVSGTSAIDTIGQAIGTLQSLGYRVTGTLVNPIDWIEMQQAKTTVGGDYLIGSPGQGATAPYLWNVPIIASSNIVEGTFLTGAFGIAAQLFDRETRLDVADQNEDDFPKNLLTFLGEIRSALTVRRPQGFLQGSLTAA